MIEKTFEELAHDSLVNYGVKSMSERINALKVKTLMAEFGKQVREATITEALEYCVSNEWIETIDNLKKMPTDKIIIYETPK